MTRSFDEYLESVWAVPWEWGVLDCCFFAGNWIRDATGRDPLASFRGRYRTAREAARLLLRGGGMVPTVGAEMERGGFVRTAMPDHGDIGVLTLPDSAGPARATCVVMSGPWWVALGEDTVSYLSPERHPVDAAWKVFS